MINSKTLLARVVTQFYPKTGYHANLVIESKGVNKEHILVERGSMTDSEIELIKKDFHFIRIVMGDKYYRIDQIVPVDNSLLKSELIAI